MINDTEKEQLLQKVISSPEERQAVLDQEPSASPVFDIQKDPYNHMIRVIFSRWKPYLLRAIAIDGGKCPLSSMSPTVVLDPEGKPFMTLGAPGGVQIYPCIAQCIVNVIDYGMNVDEALNTARIAATTTGFAYSKELPEETVAALEALGHENMSVSNAIALPSAIMYMDDGTMQGSVEIHAGMGEYGDGVAVGF